MKTIRFFIGCCALVSFATLADAADISANKIEAPIEFVRGYTYNWTGFYFGGNVGYSWATINPNVSGPGVAGGASETLSGANGGAQFGYNWQVNSFVFGIESDFQGANLRGSTSFAGVTESDNLRWFGTARARVGYVTPINRLLLYGTGGASYGQVGTTLLGSVNASLGRTRAGWTAGGGLEYGITVNWSVKAEYLYVDILDTSSGVGKAIVGSQLREDAVRLGVNYKLGGL